MLFTTTLVSLTVALCVSAAPLSSAKVARQATSYTPVTHVVEVGKDGLTYTPPFITANPGDEVQLLFFAKNHTLVQASFQDPCTPLVNGIFAGFQPTDVTADDTGLVSFRSVSFQVDTASPLWFYCAQADHCQKGMTFAINPPPGSVEIFDQRAANKTENIAPTTGPIGVVDSLVEVFIEPTSSVSYTTSLAPPTVIPTPGSA